MVHPPLLNSEQQTGGGNAVLAFETSAVNLICLFLYSTSIQVALWVEFGFCFRPLTRYGMLHERHWRLWVFEAEWALIPWTLAKQYAINLKLGILYAEPQIFFQLKSSECYFLQWKLEINTPQLSPGYTFCTVYHCQHLSHLF